jgi:CubicO group peptidase (beta-lactamase class C family)
MRAIKICFFPLVVLFCLTNSCTFAQQPTYSAAIEQRIKQVESNLGEAIKTDDKPILLLERMKEYKVPGLSIAVIKDYKIEWARGYGFADKEKAKKVTVETLFQAASISKSVNATGVLRLAQEKKIDLDRDINTYLKTWKFPYDTAKGKKTITLKHILSHTAGTSVHGFRGYATGENIPTIVQILNGEAPANSQPIRSMFDAGTRVQYSGGGTTISQLIVMDVTGLRYDAYMQKNVLAPLGMKNSFYSVPPPADKIGFLSAAYRGDGTAIKGGYHSYPENAAASLWTTPTDLAHFIIEIQLASKGKSKKVLSQQTAQLMLTPVMNNAALGVWIKSDGNEKYFGHDGANEGFRSTYFGSIDGGNGVVVMVNSDNGAILSEVVNSVATVYGWKDFYKPVIRKTVVVPAEMLDTYVGEYELAPEFKIEIKRDGALLLAKATNQPEIKLYAEEQSRFFIKEVEATIDFVKDEGGKVSKLILHQNGRDMDGKKIK